MAIRRGGVVWWGGWGAGARGVWLFIGQAVSAGHLSVTGAGERKKNRRPRDGRPTDTRGPWAICVSE
jgi:hypothetical protein